MTNHIIYFLVFITAFVSGCAVLFMRIGKKTLKLILAFSGSYLLGITILHLFPKVYSSNSPVNGSFILIGFLLQILIEYFSEGIEHGHIHVYKRTEKTFPIMMMFALSFHSFIEGIPLAGELTDTKKIFATGIILHNIPIAIAMMSMLILSSQKKKSAIFWLIFFAIMSPLGALFGNYLSLPEIYLTNILGIVIGIFLHVSTTIIFESSNEHKFNLMKLTIIIAGMAMALLGT